MQRILMYAQGSSKGCFNETFMNFLNTNTSLFKDKVVSLNAVMTAPQIEILCLLTCPKINDGSMKIMKNLQSK